MKRRSPTRKLQIESLEDRRLTAGMFSQLSAFSVPRSEIALVQPIASVQQVTLSRVIVDASSWKEGLRPNHNETLVRARRRRSSRRQRQKPV